MSEMSANKRTVKELTNVDLVIVGGAMAGATLALDLQGLTKADGSKLSIALIEAHKPSTQHPSFDARSIAIAHGSIFALTQLDLWSKLAHLGTGIGNIHVSDRGHFGMTELNASQLSLPSLGQVVELEAVGQALYQLLEDSDVKLFCPNTLLELDTQNEYQLLTLDDGQQISAQLVVAADGAHSQVRQSLRLPIKKIDFEQSAIVANVQINKLHDNWAFERFTENGPLALLPMSQLNGHNRMSLVWALKAEEAKRLQAAPEKEFVEALQQAFGYRIGHFTQVGKRHCYPLSMSYMPRPIYHRSVFIGNAAQTLHPIAGQGFNLGLRDVVCLIEVIEDALTQGKDLGDSSVLHHYFAQRESDRNTTIESIEYLVRGFSNQSWPLVMGRSLALRLLAWLPPLKVPIAKQAMGWNAVKSRLRIR